MCWQSPHSGGFQIGWAELMQLSLRERDLLIGELKEKREAEMKITAQLVR